MRLEAVQAALGTPFPEQLLALYAETDGIYVTGGEWYLIWPLERVLAENLHDFANAPPPRSEYVGFGDDGTGDPYCVTRDGGETVYHFHNIELEVNVLTNGLVSFLGG